MSKILESNPDLRQLQDNEVDAVLGAGVSAGYGPFIKYNISPFSVGAHLDPLWDLVGLTGHLPQ